MDYIVNYMGFFFLRSLPSDYLYLKVCIWKAVKNVEVNFEKQNSWVLHFSLQELLAVEMYFC